MTPALLQGLDRSDRVASGADLVEQHATEVLCRAPPVVGLEIGCGGLLAVPPVLVVLLEVVDVAAGEVRLRRGGPATGGRGEDAGVEGLEIADGRHGNSSWLLMRNENRSGFVPYRERT